MSETKFASKRDENTHLLLAAWKMILSYRDRHQQKQRNGHKRSFPIISPTGDAIPFHDPTKVPKEELIKKPLETDDSRETQ